MAENCSICLGVRKERSKSGVTHIHATRGHCNSTFDSSTYSQPSCPAVISSLCLLCCHALSLSDIKELCLPGSAQTTLCQTLAVCKLKGGELSTWEAGLGEQVVALLHPLLFSRSVDRMIWSLLLQLQDIGFCRFRSCIT